LASAFIKDGYILDADLGGSHGFEFECFRFNGAAKRHFDEFLEGFMFHLMKEEWLELLAAHKVRRV
jgi:hypothetical protein